MPRGVYKRSKRVVKKQASGKNTKYALIKVSDLLKAINNVIGRSVSI